MAADNKNNNEGLKLLDLLDALKRREITRFVDAYRHVKDNVNEIMHMQWVAEAMELMAPTPLNNVQKKTLVTSLYADLAKDDTNAFKDNFDVQSAIEFIWDASHNRFGVVIRRKGCFANCMPWCSDVSVVSDGDQIKVNINPLPADAAAEKAVAASM